MPPVSGSPPAVQESVADLACRVERLAEAKDRTLLGITGPPGAGKSALAAQLGECLGDRAALVGMDGFHLAQRELERLGRAGRKGAPDTFDSYGYAALLRRLRANAEEIVYAPAFDRRLEEAVAGSVAVEQRVSIIITEGNYLLLRGDGWAAAASDLDAIWYLDLPDGVRRQRLLRRHQDHGRSLECARTWALVRDERNARLIRSAMHLADLVVRVRDEPGDAG
jgi:pantothenate kinase